MCRQTPLELSAQFDVKQRRFNSLHHFKTRGWFDGRSKRLPFKLHRTRKNEIRTIAVKSLRAAGETTALLQGKEKEVFRAFANASWATNRAGRCRGIPPDGVEGLAERSTTKIEFQPGFRLLILDHIHNLQTRIFRFPFFCKGLEDHRSTCLPILMDLD